MVRLRWVSCGFVRVWAALGSLWYGPVSPRFALFVSYSLAADDLPGQLIGSRAEVPEGGITARLLRQVRLDRSVWFGRDVLKALAKAHGRINVPSHADHGKVYVLHALDRAGVPPAPVQERRRQVGRKRLSDVVYRRAAREYTRLLMRKKRTGPLYEALALRLGVSVGQAQNRVARARHYGFLQGAPLSPRVRRPVSKA
jgi:hypothetical protein